MGSLQWIGPGITDARDLGIKSYVDSVKEGDLDSSSVESQITSLLAPYATDEYVDQQDQLLATKAYIDQQDGFRVPLSEKNNPLGVLGLDAQGRGGTGRFNIPTTQR